jgi:nucleoid DNA-binding protein
MNKAELLEALVKKTDLPARDVKAVVDALFHASEGVLAKSLKKGEKVVIAGFGSFERRARRARTARNPQTGAAVKVKARKVPAFKAGASLKETVR